MISFTAFTVRSQFGILKKVGEEEEAVIKSVATSDECKVAVYDMIWSTAIFFPQTSKFINVS